MSIVGFISDLEETHFDYSLFQRQYADNLMDKNNIYRVALDEKEQVVGYISCHGQVLLHHAGKVFEIQELYVEEAYRNKGVGKLLVQSLEEALATEDYRSLEVTVNTRRAKAIEFYKECGFEQTHVKFVKSSAKDK
jgi:PhnO protein